MLHKRLNYDITSVADVPTNDKQKSQLIELTANTLSQLANSIQPDMIEVKVDTANNHIDGKVPILNMLVWVDGDGKIWHSHYRKVMANNSVVWSMSGMSSKVKRTVLFQECMTRLICLGKTRQFSYQT